MPELDRAESEALALNLQHRRIIFAMVRPVAMVAAHVGFPMKELTNFVRLGYFRQLRERGASLEDIAQIMEVSPRTARRLNHELRSDFFLPEIEHTLARRIEFMLWNEPLSRARITQLLQDVEEDEVDAALERLIEEERVEAIEGRSTRYRVTSLVSRLVDDGFARRVGALNSLLQNVAETVTSRLLDSSEDAFARTISFRVRHEDLSALRHYYNGLLERLVELESKVDANERSVPVRLSYIWAALKESGED